MTQPRRTADFPGAGSAIRAQRNHPGWSVLFLGGAWFVGHPADFPREAEAIPPRCGLPIGDDTCSRGAGHAGGCEGWGRVMSGDYMKGAQG